MKILMVNKFFYIKGGSETYYFALKRLLERNGHQVIDFSMQDDQNFDSPYAEYFVSHVDYNHGGSALAKVKAGLNIIYSKEAKKKFEQLVLETKPDLVHLHLFQHQLSPSILDVVKKYDIPTVYTAHELKMICPNYKMMHHGRICEDCKGGHYMNCLKNQCVKESYAKSAISTMEAYVHKHRHSYDAVDRIITPSAFYRKKFIEFGVDAQRVVHIPNFLDAEIPVVNKRQDNEQYYLYFGRLSEEKGIMTLVHAAGNDIPLYIVGTGPLKEQLEEYIQSHQSNNIHVLGFKSGQELTDLVGNAKAVVLPSEWYENGPYSAIEALQLSRVMIGADIGGIPELIDGNGFVFKSGDVEDLRNQILKIEHLDIEEYQQMKDRSKAVFEKYYTSAYHYNELQKVYHDALSMHRHMK